MKSRNHEIALPGRNCVLRGTTARLRTNRRLIFSEAHPETSHDTGVSAANIRAFVTETENNRTLCTIISDTFQHFLIVYDFNCGTGQNAQFFPLPELMSRNGFTPYIGSDCVIYSVRKLFAIANEDWYKSICRAGCGQYRGTKLWVSTPDNSAKWDNTCFCRKPTPSRGAQYRSDSILCKGALLPDVCHAQVFRITLLWVGTQWWCILPRW